MRETLTRDELFSISSKEPDLETYKKIKNNWDHLSKPIDGFGDFEGTIARIGAIQKNSEPSLSSRCAVIFCADNGIVSEGVSQTGKEVTFQVAVMLGQGTSSASTLGRQVSCDVLPVDIGIDSKDLIPGVIDKKVRQGTGNFLLEKAMTMDETLIAIGTGMNLAKEMKDSGRNLILTGEMGIGNTTTASALFCLLTDSDPKDIVGRGAGLSDDGLKKKILVVEQALEKYKDSFPDDKERAFEYLCDVGGLDIAALCGLFIGGSIYGIPVVIDGLITAVAALLAEILVPGCRKIMIPSHAGREKGLTGVLKLLELKPLITGNMALGEGTGAMMVLPLLDAALSFYKNASTFRDGDIKEYKRFK